MKQVVWHEGGLYSGDDAGMIVKVSSTVFSFMTSIELLAVGLHAGHRLEHKHLQ